jgi:hypothetical protein
MMSDEMPGGLVPAVRTETDARTLAGELDAAHVAELGFAPSWARLGMAWALVNHETGRTKSRWNFNAGNIIKTPSWAGSWHELPGHGLFRSYPSGEAGARDLWRLLAERYPLALEAFDDGDPNRAAEELRAKGYFEAPLAVYQKALRSFFAEWGSKFPPPAPGSGIAMIASSVLALAAALTTSSR